MSLLRPLERLFALAGFLVVGVMVLLWQTTGQTTPCSAVVVQAEPHIPEAAQGVVDQCLGHKGEGGLAGLVVDLGLAVTGQSRDKVQKRIETRLLEQARAASAVMAQSRCLVILAEGVVGRSNGGPRQFALDVAEPAKNACRDDDKK